MMLETYQHLTDEEKQKFNIWMKNTFQRWAMENGKGLHEFTVPFQLTPLEIAALRAELKHLHPDCPPVLTTDMLKLWAHETLQQELDRMIIKHATAELGMTTEENNEFERG